MAAAAVAYELQKSACKEKVLMSCAARNLSQKMIQCTQTLELGHSNSQKNAVTQQRAPPGAAQPTSSKPQ